MAVLAGRVVKVQHKLQKHVLVQRSHSLPIDATWEELLAFSQLYDIPDLEDNVIFEREGSDTKLIKSRKG